jgi:copper chaperone
MLKGVRGRFLRMTHKVLEVPEVSCGHCVSAIEGAVGALAGVESVKVDLERKDVTVDYEDAAVSLDSIIASIQEEGYGVGSAAAAQLHQIGEHPE